jgi:hypothetical protein
VIPQEFDDMVSAQIVRIRGVRKPPARRVPSPREQEQSSGGLRISEPIAGLIVGLLASVLVLALMLAVSAAGMIAFLKFVWPLKSRVAAKHPALDL